MRHDDNLPSYLESLLSKNELAIFLFHGVTNDNSMKIRNYTGKHIQTDLFVKCMNQLSKSGHAISMDEVLWHCQENISFPEKSFSVSFDDGFENNYSIVAPIMSDFKIPGIVYVTTGFVDQNLMSWIDRIEFAVENTAISKIKTTWCVDPFILNSRTDKIQFLNSVRSHVKNRHDCEPNRFADELCEILGSSVISSDHPLDLKLSWEQVNKLYYSEYISIGGHTHTHPILSFLDDVKLEYEITTSLQLLSQKANIQTKHYSYPEGLEHCFSENVINRLKANGIECCPTAIFGYNDQYVDPFKLKRIFVA